MYFARSIVFNIFLFFSIPVLFKFLLYKASLQSYSAGQTMLHVLLSLLLLLFMMIVGDRNSMSKVDVYFHYFLLSQHTFIYHLVYFLSLLFK